MGFQKILSYWQGQAQMPIYEVAKKAGYSSPGTRFHWRDKKNNDNI